MFRAFLIATFCCFCSRSLRADEDRLWVDATINGKPVKLVLDTGAEKSVLFRPMAERLGLRVTNWPTGKKSIREKFLMARPSRVCWRSGG